MADPNSVTLTDDATEHLRDILFSGLIGDIYLAERARQLHRSVAEHADAINEAGFEELFRAVQNAAVGELVLQVTRLFERPSRAYPVRSIPAAIKILRECGADLKVAEPHHAAGILAKGGFDVTGLRGRTGDPFTEGLAGLLAATCPEVEKAGHDRLSRGLEALRTSRDKRIAHNEAVDMTGFTPPRWREAEALLAYAEHVLGALAMAYFASALFTDGGYHVVGADGGKAGRQLRSLLVAADVIDAPNNDPARRLAEYRRQKRTRG